MSEVFLNEVNLIGGLNYNSTFSTTANGKSMLRFSVVCKETGKDNTVYRSFIPVVAWGKLAEKHTNLSAGSLVYVHGKLRSSSWEKDGTKRTSIQVHADKISVILEKTVTPLPTPPPSQPKTPEPEEGELPF